MSIELHKFLWIYIANILSKLDVDLGPDILVTHQLSLIIRAGAAP